MPFMRYNVKVNRCDLASAKLGLKAMGQENKRLVHKIRGQASRVRTLEASFGVCANFSALSEHFTHPGFNQQPSSCIRPVLCRLKEMDWPSLLGSATYP